MIPEAGRDTPSKAQVPEEMGLFDILHPTGLALEPARGKAPWTTFIRNPQKHSLSQ